MQFLIYQLISIFTVKNTSIFGHYDNRSARDVWYRARARNLIFTLNSDFHGEMAIFTVVTFSLIWSFSIKKVTCYMIHCLIYNAWSKSAITQLKMYFPKIVHAMWIPKNRNPLARGHLNKVNQNHIFLRVDDVRIQS